MHHRHFIDIINVYNFHACDFVSGNSEVLKVSNGAFIEWEERKSKPSASASSFITLSHSHGICAALNSSQSVPYSSHLVPFNKKSFPGARPQA